MRCRVVDLRNKEVINIKTGMRLGCVDDVEVDTENARVLGIVIFGRLRCFGVLGREEDIFIRWEDIKVIGDDTVLINCGIGRHKRKKKFKIFNNMFRF